MKNEKPLFHHVLQCVSCWKKELPDGDRRQGRRDYTKCPGTRSRGVRRATGVIQRRRKFTAVSLLRMLVLTLLRKPDAKATDFQSTAAQLGLDVTSTAVENRFTPQLVGSSVRCSSHCAPGVGRVASNRRPAEQVHERSHWRQQYHRLPDDWPTSSPAVAAYCGGWPRSRSTCCGLPHRLDPPTANHPRHAATLQPDRSGGRPAGSLSLFDLGYFCLDRFQNLTRAGAFWMSRLQHGTSVFDARASLGAVAIPAAADRVGTDRRVGPAGREPSPACRLIALRVPKRWPTGGDRKLREGQKHGRVPSREYLEWQDWTIFVTIASRIADVGGRRRALPRRWLSTYVQTLEVAQPARDTPRSRVAEEQLAVVYVKLIAVLVQHLILLTATWCECRRS